MELPGWTCGNSPGQPDGSSHLQLQELRYVRAAVGVLQGHGRILANQNLSRTVFLAALQQLPSPRLAPSWGGPA